MPKNTAALLTKLIQEARPDIDIREFTAFYQLFIKPHALLEDPLIAQIDALKDAQSLQTAKGSDLDLLVANYFLSRDTGNKASGVARIFFDTPTTIAVLKTVQFLASNGSTYSPTQDFFLPESLMRLQRDGSLFYADVPITANTPGISAKIEAHQLIGFVNDPFIFVRVDNPFPFIGGGDPETDAQLTLRAEDSVTVRDLVSAPGVRTQLLQNFPFIERIFVAGFLDPEMERDLFEGIHIGGKGDVFIDSGSLQTDQVKILLSDALGNYALSSDTNSLEGDTKKPVVFIDAVRLLGAGPSFTPIDPPLHRTEAILSAPHSLVPTGTYEQPFLGYNPTLDQLSTVAVEVLSPGEKYVSYSLMDIQGVALVAFSRVSTASSGISSPSVVVSPINNHAYIFWVLDGNLIAKILDQTGAVVRENFTPVVGTDPVIGPVQAVVNASGNILVTFTRRIANSQDNPWYFKLAPNGDFAAGGTPKQLTTNFAGENRSPSIIVQGTVTTVFFTSTGSGGVNIFAVQLNASSTITTADPVEITSGFDLNDFVTIQPGPANSILTLWRKNFNTLAFARILTSGLSPIISPIDVFTRQQAIQELSSHVNPYGQIYGVWTENFQSFPDIFTTKVDITGTQIGAVQNVTNTPYASATPNMAIDTSGFLHFVWTDGAAGSDKPFYTKRSPQEWHLLVKEKGLRYSLREALTIVPEVPAVGGIAVDFRWSSQLPSVQDYVSSDTHRTILSDLLIRAQIPGTVSCSISYTGGPSATAAVQLVSDYITAFQESILATSAIITLLQDAGASQVSPFILTLTIDQPSGLVETFTSNDTVSVPRGIILSPGIITAVPR